MTLAHPSQIDLYRPSIFINASKTLELSDAGKFLVCNSLSAIILTIPPNIFIVDTEIEFMQWNTGAVSVIAGSGVSIVRFGGTVHQLLGQGAIGVLKQITLNNWLLAGVF